MATRRRRWSGFTKAQRDAVLFVGGLVGVVHTVVWHYDSPSLALLGVYAGMMFTVPALRLRDYIKDRDGQ